MKRLSAGLAALFATVTCHAQYSGQAVAIYKNHISVKITGAPQVVKEKLTGFTVLDPDKPRAIQLLILNNQYNQYLIRTNTDLFIVTPGVGNAKTEMCLVRAHSTGHGQVVTACAKGNYTQFLINNLPWSGAKTLSWSGRAVYTYQAYPVLEESSGSLVLDIGETTVAGQFADTVDTAVDRLNTRLINAGYSRAGDPVQ